MLTKKLIKKKVKVGGGGGGGGGTKTKTVCQTVSNEVKYKKCNYLHNMQHVVQSIFQNTFNNNFLSTNPTTFILSSLVSEF